ncbi:MAG: DUF357 domain-containing protein [Candidatus Woesearchaeota archaeon]|jgi:hypothetical protein
MAKTVKEEKTKAEKKVVDVKSDVITTQKLDKYFKITEEAFDMATKSKNRTALITEREDFILMITCYIKDAHHFKEKNDFVNAFAALNYAHGWLDSGARLGIFDVHDSRLFTVDD